MRRLVDEVMNGNDLDVLDEICSPALAPEAEARLHPVPYGVPGLASGTDRTRWRERHGRGPFPMHRYAPRSVARARGH